MLKIREDNHKRLYDFEVTKEGAIKLQKRSEGMKVSLMSDTMLYEKKNIMRSWTTKSFFYCT